MFGTRTVQLKKFMYGYFQSASGCKHEDLNLTGRDYMCTSQMATCMKGAMAVNTMHQVQVCDPDMPSGRLADQPADRPTDQADCK